VKNSLGEKAFIATNGSAEHKFEPVFAARPEPATLSLRLCAARGAGGERLAGWRPARRPRGPRGQENGWEVASDGAGWATGWARRRWKRAFDFPILILILSYTLALSIGTISSNMMYEMTVRGRAITYQVGASG
jgi:hypothetical protein